MEPKKYGLIRLSKTDASKTQPKITKNIFDSDSDEESNAPPKRVATSSGIKRQTQLDISRALTDDPTVFEYDSIYDEMKSQKESNEDISGEVKEKPKPKYINNLLKYSETRKKENERRIERKIQKEREEEGNQFEDKEEFVTNAYKEKLEEIRAADERDLKEQAIEELLDVKKQNDLSGFYRHLLNRETDKTVSLKESNPNTSDVIAKEDEQKIQTSFPKSKTNRHIRERRSSSSDSSPEIEEKSVKTNKESERKSSRLEVSAEREKPKTRKESEMKDTNEVEVERNRDNGVSVPSKRVKKEKIENNENTENNENQTQIPVNEETKKIEKLDKRQLLLKIFTKRTVDQVFSDAQMRYYQRKDNYVI